MTAAWHGHKSQSKCIKEEAVVSKFTYYHHRAEFFNLVKNLQQTNHVTSMLGNFAELFYWKMTVFVNIVNWFGSFHTQKATRRLFGAEMMHTTHVTFDFMVMQLVVPTKKETAL